MLGGAEGAVASVSSSECQITAFLISSPNSCFSTSCFFSAPFSKSAACLVCVFLKPQWLGLLWELSGTAAPLVLSQDCISVARCLGLGQPFPWSELNFPISCLQTPGF